MSPLRGHWSLDPTITFLNHGSFGACPTQVLEAQSALRARMEAQPVRFLVRELEPLLDAAREELARFVGADPSELVFVPNATYGVNSVLRSLRLAPGEELLTTNQEYNASRNALEFVAQQSGARVVVAQVPFPLQHPDQVMEAILAAVTPRTRLLLVDHVTSQTGLIFPIERLVRELDQRGIDTLVDGAHGPGMVPLQLRQLGAAYYTGNLHKWVCAPKGAALLHVRADRQERIRPLAISHGANSPRTDRSRFWVEFDWTGTSDPTAVLCVPQALRTVGGMLPGGWEAVMAHNRSTVLDGRNLLCQALGIASPAPDSMIGALAAVPLPEGSGHFSALSIDPLQDALLFQEQIEVPIVPWPRPPARLLRISAQLYNTPQEYQRLAEVLPRLLAQEL
ncbi:MAG: aminotransferase class V-fold PLP-dependent enzyme [Myxococcota bacterium]|nr:aminotransferase class V-fold PLP-dependent enzyme [Myxococcota bacterium]